MILIPVVDYNVKGEDTTILEEKVERWEKFLEDFFVTTPYLKVEHSDPLDIFCGSETSWGCLVTPEGQFPVEVFPYDIDSVMEGVTKYEKRRLKDSASADAE